ncbi:MAG: glycosyltransferase [Acidimicrobiia bacterium]|nr:glycosyltransferase [Acidimicrobiia bacterium]
MSRLRVGLEATSLLGPRTGIGTYTAGLARALGEAGRVDLVLFALTWRGRHGLGRAAAELGLDARVVTRPAPARPLRESWKRAEAPTLEWWTGSLDVVHGPNYVVPPTRRAARVVSVHDLTPMLFPELCTRDTLDYPRLVRRAAEHGAWLQVATRHVAGELGEWLGWEPERLAVVPVGAPAAVTGDPAIGRRLAGFERYVLALGTVEPRKNLPLLVEAFDRAAPERPGLGLVIAGPAGWGEEALQAALGRARHADRVRRLGWVSADDRSHLLTGARCLAYPSRYEGFGIPPLEAMASGTPVVTSDQGTVVEVTAGAALHAAVDDASELAAALVTLDADEGRRAALVAAGRLRAATFTWEGIASAMTRLYERAAKG